MTRRTLIGMASVVVVALVGGTLGTVLAAEPEPREPLTVRTLVQPAVGELPGTGSDMAEATARIGVTGDAIAANAMAILEHASSAPDPQAAAQARLATGRVDAPRDTCVLTGQSPPGSCPAGLYGNVIAQPQPRIQAASVAEPQTCDTADDEVALSVLVDQDSPVTVSWWAEGVPVRERIEPSGSDCIILDALMPATAYTAHVRVGDDWRRFAFESSGGVVRPGAVVYALTDDLVAVTVPHRRGERVAVYPNVISSTEPPCDPVVAGYDTTVHELGRVTGSVDAEVLAAASLDEAFTERTTIGYDIGEGITVFLCVVVTTADGTEDYRAETMVQTADRLSPELVVTSARGRNVAGWALTAWLPSGQRCGSWQPDGPVTNRQIALELDSASLCDTSDPAQPPDAEPPEGRGVLPFSAGSHSTLTVNVDFPQVGPSYTTLDLGPTALCTGSCTPPARPSYFVVQGALGEATLLLLWTQGSTNGAAETTVAPVTDSITLPVPGPRLDVSTSNVRLNSAVPDTRGVTVALVLRADRPATYVASLEPVPGDTACERPGAVLEHAGVLPPEPFTVPTFLEFEGLCHGTEYQTIVELTDADGVTTRWGPPGGLTSWGSASRVSVPAVATTAEISVQLSGGSGPAAYLTLRADGTTLIGPRAGGCPGVGFTGSVDELVVLPLGETTRFSGVLELPNTTQGAGRDESCVPFWGSGRPGIPFDLELTWDELLGNGPGVATELVIVDQSVRGLDGAATVAAIITIVPR